MEEHTLTIIPLTRIHMNVWPAGELFGQCEPKCQQYRPSTELRSYQCL